MVTIPVPRCRVLPVICAAAICIGSTVWAGMGGEADKLKVGMNHAAEDAVADAKPIF